MKIETNGKTISYRRSGKGHPILFIHAFPFSRLMWEDQLLAVAPTHTGVALDLPGFGGSTALAETETTIAAYADACEIVMNKVAPGEPWIVCGLSMGGYVAFELIRRARVKLRALILSNTRAVNDTPEQRAVRVAMIEKARAGGAAIVAELQLSRMLTDECDSEIVKKVDHWMRKSPPDGLMGALNALLQRADSVPTLATIHVPTLVIAGEHDPVSPVAEMQQMASAIANSRFITIPGARHLSNIEFPEEYNNILVSWLAEIDPVPEEEEVDFDEDDEGEDASDDDGEEFDDEEFDEENVGEDDDVAGDAAGRDR